MFQVEVVWNSAFKFVPFGTSKETLREAIEFSQVVERMGDGASVKKTQIRDRLGNVVYAYSKEVPQKEKKEHVS